MCCRARRRLCGGPDGRGAERGGEPPHPRGAEGRLDPALRRPLAGRLARLQEARRGRICAGRSRTGSSRCRRDGTGTGKPGDIISKDTFEQFELSFEWRVAQGRQQRRQVLRPRGSEFGHRARVSAHRRRAGTRTRRSDRTGRPRRSTTCSRRPTVRSKPAGEINTTRIVVRGKNVEHWLNGKRVLQYELDSPARPRRDREEQVQGRRALRQAAERPHPPAGPRRSGVVPQHQDPQAVIRVGLLGAGNISDTHARAAQSDPGRRDRGGVRGEPRESRAPRAPRTAAWPTTTSGASSITGRSTSWRSAARRGFTRNRRSRRSGAACTSSRKSRWTSRPRRWTPSSPRRIATGSRSACSFRIASSPTSRR